MTYSLWMLPVAVVRIRGRVPALPHTAAVVLRHRSLVSMTRLPAPPLPDGQERHKKRHALLTFGFCGTDYYGLQSQSAEGDPELPTVGDVIRRALLAEGFIAPTNFAPLTRTKWMLASRTDKGVHAACAAASCRIETLAADVELPSSPGTDAGPPVLNVALSNTTDWSLSRAALERLNARLPAEVRIFSGSRVRKGFDARECASSRTYEYLLPVHALGEGTPEAFDETLRRFEGTHRMHNFASGLRVSQQDAPSFTCASSGASWPLGLRDGPANGAAYRSVLTSRVHRRVEVGERGEEVPFTPRAFTPPCSRSQVGGEEYLVLRISGLAFVLHQIRHMVGTALAVSNGIVPCDALDIGLNSPLRVDVSPLVPGCGLLLDELRFFDVKNGEYEATLPAEARGEMESYKREVPPSSTHLIPRCAPPEMCTSRDEAMPSRTLPSTLLCPGVRLARPLVTTCRRCSTLTSTLSTSRAPTTPS